ncbi:hypothetical protein ABID23_000954 [Bartonella silvatica]|uniref:Transmembrane protein n=1 Tax=Bartonella silvatica TaxID=357760 RepID=A0ABV2HH43_9HYPH
MFWRREALVTALWMGGMIGGLECFAVVFGELWLWEGVMVVKKFVSFS